MRNLILLLVIFMAFPAFGQRKKQADTETTPAYTEGITYALPRTGVYIQVEVIKETFEPGPYAKYASQLLGITDVRNNPSVKWVIRDVGMDTFTEPDPEQVHKAMGDAAFLVNLSPSGCLAGIASENGSSDELQQKTFSYIDEDAKEQDYDFSQFNHSPAYTQGDSTNNFRPVRVNDEKKAVEAANRILESRNTRFHMAAGLMDEFHPDGEAYEVSIEELEKTEKNYLSLFTGRTSYEKHKVGFHFVPTSSSEKGDVVFRFSEESGVLPAANVTGKPVMLRVEPEKSLVSKYSELAASENPDAGSSGIYYRMPAMVNINLIYELNTIASTRVLLPQFGKVAPVPEELLTGEYSIKIHPGTGAVKSVSRK
ncbi:MAG: DUF4831 family protein [Mariniphaga sp.]